ncbi:MAG TPA: Ig-like domain-containing protein [Gemmatimonadales bacterium]
MGGAPLRTSRQSSEGHPPISLAAPRLDPSAAGVRRAAAAAVAALAACANIQPPPGGPPDTTPPELASVYPESLAVLPGFKGSVQFSFNEVVSEGTSPSQGLGTGDLEKLVILSPTDRVPDIGWHRRRISVRPAEGWKPNRVYRVELLPGISDVRQNKAKFDDVVTFTTGAPLPRDTLTGRVFDWKAGNPAALALVEAVLEPDSLPYRALADSSGHFSFGPLPRGEYLVFGVLDANRNFRRDPREAFDTVRIRPESATAAVPELYAFVHDTLPPRLTEASPSDSVTATLTFAQPLDPFQKLDSSLVSVRQLPDSTPVPVVSLGLQSAQPAGLGPGLGAFQAPLRPADTSAKAAAKPADTTAAARRADTTAARRIRALADSAAVRLGRRADTTGAPGAAGAAAAAARAMHRPALTDRLVLKVGRPWHPGDRFLIDLMGIRTVSGTAGNPRGVLAIPVPRGAPGAADSLKADSLKADSLKAAPADSARADSLRGDSLKTRHLPQ